MKRYFDHCVHFVDGGSQQIPVGKVICVGLNYSDHVAEMGSQRADEPVIFLKPASALVPLEEPVAIPLAFGACHYEAEMSVLIGEQLTDCNEEQAAGAIIGVGVALDLTLRDLQSQFKQKGHPWDKAKGFDGACPASAFVDRSQVADLQSLELRLTINGKVKQASNTRQMITPVLPLITYISQYFTLMPGDIVLTGTPAGVGPLCSGDTLTVELVDVISVNTCVVAR
ncbi:MAG: fumarylacetoacetate hydrolase family protein [Porticoccus sp.]|nr:fumarylacetoacetate hydrolase family protein [Porticoccus sp.]